MVTCIDQLKVEELRGKRVLVRAGFDVPLNDQGEVADLFRVQRSAETLKYLAKCGAKVIVLSHIGRDPKETNEPVAKALRHYLPVVYVPSLLGAAAKDALGAMKEGEVVLLENLRQDPRETSNDEAFARQLAAFGDLYVNDAFSAAHRAHASIVGIPKYRPHYAGLLMRDEVRVLQYARHPEFPSLAILGGAKFETKEPLVKLLLGAYDRLFLTGALANDVFKARGLPVGRSLISESLPTEDVLSHPHFMAPLDVTVERPDGQARVKKPLEVEADDKIVDIGPDSVAALAPFISEAKFILWNGPTGLYEDGYTSYTHAIAELIAHRVTEGAQVVIGGGDTIAAIIASGISQERMGFLSTGGGAMLEYLLKGTLPAIEALN